MSTPVLLLLALLCAVECQFACQNILNTYNNHVNVGNFSGAAELTFAANVTYYIPGPNTSYHCPYCAVWSGAAAVEKLFIQGFLGHFTIVNPLVNLRQLYTNTGGPGGVPRLMDFNDEAFRILPQFGGQYFRVAVIHDFLFEPPPSCRITAMHLYHDPYVVTLAFGGKTVPQVPIMPGLTLTPPATSYQVTSIAGAQLLDWQFIPGENLVSSASAQALIEIYYEAVKDGSILTPATIASLFIALDYSLPSAEAAIYVPGAQSGFAFSGLYMGVAEVLTYHEALMNTTTISTPMDAGTNSSFVATAGSVAYQWTLMATCINSGNSYVTNATDYFQIINQSGGLRIARLTRFFDTFAVAFACR